MYNNLLLHNISPSIISFIGPKPIGEIPCRNSYIKLWWKYAELSPIYDLIKKYKHNGKYKLAATTAQNSFKYTWLLSRIWPYIKPYWFRITLGFLIAIPLGLLDGVTAFALKPYMNYVVAGKAFAFSFHGLDFSISSIQMSFIIPFGVILFAIVQGVLRYLNGYFSSWVSAHITNDVKFDLFKRLVYMDPQFFDENSSGIIISRYMGDPTAASAGIVENIKTITTSFFGAFGLIAVMLYSSWKLAFIGVLVLCIAFLPVALIRKRIKEASNKSMVIGGNITTNISEELVNAIKSAHLEDMIKELADGLETELGERGLTLSGGQRQRVAIARAMIKNAPIVILDEATSALDNESEAIVQKAMDNLMKDRTVFIIAHRLSTIKNADRIAVINEGQLVELGTHNELMSIENGQYRALYEMQFKKQEVGV